jgi:glycogen phosphorylase
MNKEKTKFGSPIYAFLPTDVEGFDSLAELVLDMRWS